MSQVSIEAVVTPVVSHAMAHTNISPVQRIEIANAGAAREAAELTVGVTDGQGSLSHAWSKRLDLAAESSIALGDVGLRLRADMMEQVEEADVDLPDLPGPMVPQDVIDRHERGSDEATSAAVLDGGRLAGVGIVEGEPAVGGKRRGAGRRAAHRARPSRARGPRRRHGRSSGTRAR